MKGKITGREVAVHDLRRLITELVTTAKKGGKSMRKLLLWAVVIVAVVLIGLGIRSSLLKSKQHARLYDFPETGY